MVMKKLESLIFYLFIFAVPVQTRLILHSWTRPFNQWTSAYLYGTDILLGLLLIFWFVRSAKINNGRIFNFQFSVFNEIKDLKTLILNSGFLLLLFFAISALSILNSHMFGLSLYQLLKLAEFIGFYFYLRLGFGKIFSFRMILLVIITSGLFQSVIAIAQYIKQGSLGLRLLGESPLSVNASGVAVFIADSHKYLRAYGTTPHPNILAAWLFVAIFAFYFYYLYFDRGKNSMILVAYATMLFAFFFTFSRTIIGLWSFGTIILVLAIYFNKNFKNIDPQIKSRAGTLVIATLIVVATFSLLFWPQVKSRIHISAQEEAVTQRVFYNKIAGSVAVSHPLIGIGIGQFIPAMMTKFKHLPAIAYQPAHNIYLLIASETGFLGLATFLAFLASIFWRFFRQADFKKLHTFLLLIFSCSFLVAGLFDHFLWTLQQGSLILWIAMAIIDSSDKIRLP